MDAVLGRQALAAAVAVGAAAASACLDTATPAPSPVSLLWHYPSQVSCRLEAPASDGQRVFVPFSDGYVRALSLDSGTVKWQTLVGGPLFDDIKIMEGRVIVQAGQGIVALDPHSGATLWVRSDSVDYPRGTLSLDTLAGGVVSGSQQRSLWGLNIADGSVSWKIDLGQAARSTVTEGRLVYAGTVDPAAPPADATGHIFAVDLDTKTVQWTFYAPKLQVSSGFVAPLAAAAGVVVGNSANGRVYGVDAASGLEKWHFDGGVFLGGSISDGQAAFVPSNDGNLYALNLQTGTQLWAAHVSVASLYTEPALFGDRLVLAKAGDTIYGLDRSSGARAWSYSLNNSSHICSTPLVVGDLIVFDAEDGIYAVRAPQH